MDLEKRIFELEKKLKETKLKAAQKAAAKKASDQAAARAIQQRKFRIAGEFLLDGATDVGALLNAKNERFDAWLKSSSERNLFNLPLDSKET
jgi:F0F1-type ATP synthase assembly protein I